ncbi:bifunctional 2-C-methyl-D-erythritol 4-phosphate cytidylyltransferase/2-C-methyl-D-erythritol 2,4-cyclodiphosphate synthase [Candidatus Hepatincolaceae symbiont of Richtersius coronifer]
MQRKIIKDKNDEQLTVVLLMAGGIGMRSSNFTPKQYMSFINDKSLLEESLITFLNHPLIDYVQPIINQDHQNFFYKILGKITHNKSKILPYCFGGAERKDSVLHGLTSLINLNPSKVLIHDSARPFVSVHTITDIINAIEEGVGVVPALKVVDSVKKLKSSLISENLSMEDLYTIQTPQGFHYKEIMEAFMEHKDLSLSDDSAYFLRHSKKIKVIEGSLLNSKINFKEDIETIRKHVKSLTSVDNKPSTLKYKALTKLPVEKGNLRDDLYVNSPNYLSLDDISLGRSLNNFNSKISFPKDINPIDSNPKGLNLNRGNFHNFRPSSNQNKIGFYGNLYDGSIDNKEINKEKLYKSLDLYSNLLYQENKSNPTFMTDMDKIKFEKMREIRVNQFSPKESDESDLSNDLTTNSNATNKVVARDNINVLRVGQGIDIHEFSSDESDNKVLYLGGIKIDSPRGLKGHSDADVVLHALVDALLGGVGEGDIGEHFPPSDDRWKGFASSFFLEYANALIIKAGYKIVNIDIVILAEEPMISPYKLQMRLNIAKILKIHYSRINIKATTTEKLGFIGRKEGILATTVASLSSINN